MTVNCNGREGLLSFRPIWITSKNSCHCRRTSTQEFGLRITGKFPEGGGMREIGLHGVGDLEVREESNLLCVL